MTLCPAVQRIQLWAGPRLSGSVLLATSATALESGSAVQHGDVVDCAPFEDECRDDPGCYERRAGGRPPREAGRPAATRASFQEPLKRRRIEDADGTGAFWLAAQRR